MGYAQEKVTRMGTTEQFHHCLFISSGNDVLRGIGGWPDDPGSAGLVVMVFLVLTRWPRMAGPPASIATTLVSHLKDETNYSVARDKEFCSKFWINFILLLPDAEKSVIR